MILFELLTLDVPYQEGSIIIIINKINKIFIILFFDLGDHDRFVLPTLVREGVRPKFPAAIGKLYTFFTLSL